MRGDLAGQPLSVVGGADGEAQSRRSWVGIVSAAETIPVQKPAWDDSCPEAGGKPEQSVDLKVGELPEVVVVDVLRLSAEAGEQVGAGADRVPVART